MKTTDVSWVDREQLSFSIDLGIITESDIKPDRYIGNKTAQDLLWLFESAYSVFLS